MNFALTDDQIMIRDAAESFLGDVSASAAVRAAMESEDGFDARVWARIGAELGWCGVGIPEAFGGLGLGPVELVLIQEQAGRHLLCAPFFSTVCLAANLLQESGTSAAREQFLSGIAAGSLRATTPLPSEAGDWLDDSITLRAQPTDTGWTLSGDAPRVPDGVTADWLFLLAHIEGAQPALFAVPRNAKGVQIKALTTWDATRRFASLRLESVEVKTEARLDAPSLTLPRERGREGVGVDGFARAAALARLYIAAEQLGGAQHCLDLTVAYTAGRKQFGRTINSFQAVKHRCAEMMVRVEALRSAVYGAAAFATGKADTAALTRECAMARVLAAETFFHCAQEAIQLHGGVGFTWEFDPQLYFKRAQAGSHWLGGADALREIIARSLLDAPSLTLPRERGREGVGV